MDQYIRDFSLNTIETYTLSSCTEAKTILNVNSNVSNFKILHNNIRSLNKNLDEFKILLKNLEINFDCLILTETWKLDDPNLFGINGYDMIYNFGDLNQNDGTVAYIRSNLNYCYQIKQLNSMKLLQIVINVNKNTNFNIMAVYRSPSTDPYEFNIHLQNYFQLINFKQNDYYIFVGDINIDILQINEYICGYINVLSEFGFTSTINNATRIDKNHMSCIDHIFIKAKHNNTDFLIPIIIETDITDHYTTVLQIVLQNTQNENLKSCIKIIDDKKLKAKISTVIWDEVHSETNIDYATNKFIEIITLIINDCTTTKKYVRKNIKQTKWITTAILKSVNKKNEMAKKFKKDPNNLELKSQYKNYKNALTKLIKKTKQNYYQNIINVNK